MKRWFIVEMLQNGATRGRLAGTLALSCVAQGWRKWEGERPRAPVSRIGTVAMLVLLGCGVAFAGTTNVPAQTGFAQFQAIAERNVFNPNRVPVRRGSGRVENARPSSADLITLVGTMSYTKGTFAFFSGSTADYQKALERDGKIAGFTVAAIQPDAVTLTTSNRTVELPVGGQLQRDAEIGWMLVPVATQAVVQAEAQESSSPAGDSSGGAPGDILKKLMQKRKQELQ